MKAIIPKPETTLAENLYSVQEQIAFLKEQEDELKGQLLTSLKEQGVSFLKLDNGTTFTRSHRETLKIKDPAKAELWLDEHDCWKADTTKAMKILRRELKMPKFFTREIGADYLTIKKHGEKDDDSQ